MPAFPKPRPHLLEIRAKRARIKVRDLKARDQVKLRSSGRCEVIVYGRRCTRSAFHVHHLLGGIGRRGVGLSASWRTQLHVCRTCHAELHGHVLIARGSLEQRSWAKTIRYQRIA